MYKYKYPRPALTVDIVIFAMNEDDLNVLLIRRKGEPFQGQWAIPGGFVEMDETLETSARRELEEETGLKNIFLEQLYTFGGVNRDPRERTVSVAYYALVQQKKQKVISGSDASEAKWFAVSDLPELAFDHQLILDTALERLRGKVRYQPVGFELLPRKFTLRQLQNLYEVILGRELDKRNFRKKILSMDILVPLNETEKAVAHRAAKLFRFDKRNYDQLVKQGFLFEV